MASAKYLGYVGGAAVAVGVGAALATAGQGTAHAETDGTQTSAASKGPEKKIDKVHKAVKAEKKESAAKLEKKVTNLSGEVTSAVKSAPKAPKFDPADAVQKLQKQFKADVEPASPKLPTKFEAKSVTPTAGFTDLATKAGEAAASLTKLAAITRAGDVITPLVADPTPPPWGINPLRPMPPEPAPTDMPAALWKLEKTFVNASPNLLQPWVREGIEQGYRLTQMIPFVNAVVPVINVVGDLPAALNGDKYATQRIVNNLIVTLEPVAILYYGYDIAADLLNVEVPAAAVKQQFFATAWNVLDWFDLFHVHGESGIPLSTASPEWWCTTTNCDIPAGVTNEPNINLARAFAITSTDDFGSDPFRPDDPWPTDMPAALLSKEQSTVALLSASPLAPLAPYYREAFEAAYRASQIVPFVNAPIPLSAVVAAIIAGGPDAIQVSVNGLLLTTPPVSLLYYGYDELADLLNVEDEAYAQKNAFYALVWDTLDPNGLVHVLGESGL